MGKGEGTTTKKKPLFFSRLARYSCRPEKKQKTRRKNRECRKTAAPEERRKTREGREERREGKGEGRTMHYPSPCVFKTGGQTAEEEREEGR